MSVIEEVKLPSAKALKLNIMRMLHAFALVGLTSVFSLFMASQVSGATCESLYSDESYDEAIPLCLAEKSYFTLGWIYYNKDDCANMELYYRLSPSPNAKGNLGINLLYGKNSCRRDVLEGISLLEEGVTGGNNGYANILGNHYRSENNSKLAIEWYSKAIEVNLFSGDSDWASDRARESYYELIQLLDDDALKAFHLNIVTPEINLTVRTELQDEMAARAIIYLNDVLTLTEQSDLLFNPKLSSKLRCDWSEKLYQNSFQELVPYLLDQSRFQPFVDNLCSGSQEYFLGKTYEFGLGNKEDFQEAYRLYLMAGSRGNTLAKEARDNIRDQLSPEQIAEAVCLADYGMEPAYYQKLLCKF